MSMLAKRTRLEVRDRVGSYALTGAGSVAVPAGYKLTELGLFPEDWQIQELGDWKPFVTSGSRGWADYYSDHGSAFIRITNMSRESIYLDLDDLKFVNLPPDSTEGVRTRLQDGDLLVSITADIGIIAFVDSNVPKPAYINQHIALVRFDPEKVDSRFLSYFLASERPQKAFRAGTDQGAKAGMNLRGVREIKAAFPLLAEQRAIAAALSDVDALLAKLEQLIAKKRDLKQAAQEQLLDARARLAGFSKRWSRVRLGDLLQFQVGYPFISAYFNKAGQGIRIIKNRDLKGDDSIFHYAGRYDDDFVVKNGDVLIGMDGDFIPCKWSGGDALLNQRVGRIVVKEGLDPLYAYYALAAPLKKVEEITSGTTVKHLSHTDVENIELDLPEKLEQIAIARTLSDMDAELAALEARRAKTRELKQGMMQALLTGRIRLI